MINIAIITFHRAHNYGSILQAYALQKYIKGLDIVKECTIIDFSNAEQQEMYNVFHSTYSVKNLIKNIVAIFFYKKFKTVHDDFECFIESKLKLSPQRYSTSIEMKSLEEKYDCFIAGSDQVWNIMCPDHDDVYFLNFISKKPKIAYAPSFGARNINVCAKHPEKYRNLINKFVKLSIREKNGQKWIKELTGLDVPLLIDPTMFYDQEEWSGLMSEPLISGKFILYYSFGFTHAVSQAVAKISKKLKMPVIMLNPRAWVYKLGFLYGFKLAQHAGPSEFLRLVNDAELISSNSFHGTVFSAIFRKNFWYLYSNESNPDDDRAKTMVEQMKIEDRILDIDKIEDCDFYRPVDYKKMEFSLAYLRKKAFNYINESINSIRNNL